MNIFKQLVPIKFSSRCTKKPCNVINCSLFHSSSNGVVEVHSQEHEVVIALGSNMGDRLHNFDEALDQMRKSGIRITRHGCLYETAPAYVTDQPQFLNSAIRAVTKLGPFELLRILKKIEKDIGRTDGIRYGPRPIDLDILFYGKFKIHSESLVVPHERLWERPFVVGPLIDLLGSDIENDTVACWHSFSGGGLFELWDKLGGKDGMRRVLPVANRLWDWSTKTSVMGILNLTPDSFSDGGKFLSVESAVTHARTMLLQGADIIDIGAQSSRPMASKISPEEELGRLIPVVEAVTKMPEAEGKLFSIDTFYSEVALEAISKGVHMVNDVSSGFLDSNMHPVVAGLKVPYIALHARGTSTTMQNVENLRYGNVCREVANELYERARAAEVAGIPAWRIIVDPGIGYSKNTNQNLDLLVGLGTVRTEMGKRSLALSRSPLLVGPSRKRFLGDVCDRPMAAERDPATVASIAAAVLNGADIVRVHNVRDNLDAVKLCDAMLGRKKTI
ncbi:hypothetical protein DM860_002340 [Cuscuta australis]|uniref:Pterin-binding domain-containing protein n=1 Tax=Cuscuta australis TaxID=267555 RepID=A0A328CY38_9ASTE|nr:hypothetical protein DM860_002340 [Cuscuta australis]